MSLADVNVGTCPGICALASRGPSKFRVPLWGKVYLLTLIFECVCLIALSAALFVVHDPVLPTGQIYAGLGIYCVLGLLYFGMDAVLSENQFQFIAANVISVMFTFFVCFQVFHNPTTLGRLWADIRYEAMAVKLAFQAGYFREWSDYVFTHARRTPPSVVLAVLFWPVWQSFGYFTYRIAGANPELKRLYRHYRVFLTLIKLDMYSAGVLLLLAKFYLMDTQGPDFIISMISIAVSIAFFGLGWWAVTHEKKLLFWCFLAASLLQPAFIGFKWYYLYEHASELPKNVTYPQFVVIGGLCLVLRAGLLLSAIRVYREFGQGLKELVFRKYKQAQREEQQRAFAKRPNWYEEPDARAPDADAVVDALLRDEEHNIDHASPSLQGNATAVSVGHDARADGHPAALAMAHTADTSAPRVLGTFTEVGFTYDPSAFR